jgi:hypothetical protein
MVFILFWLFGGELSGLLLICAGHECASRIVGTEGFLILSVFLFRQ